MLNGNRTFRSFDVSPPGRFAPGRFAAGRFVPGRFAPGRFAPSQSTKSGQEWDGVDEEERKTFRPPTGRFAPCKFCGCIVRILFLALTYWLNLMFRLRLHWSLHYYCYSFRSCKPTVQVKWLSRRSSTRHRSVKYIERTRSMRRTWVRVSTLCYVRPMC